MKTTLLIGSGVSYHSRIPGLNEITTSILTSSKIGKDTDMNYYFEGYWGYGIQEYLNGYVISCQSLLNIVKEKIDEFYEHIRIEHTTNYEDIYYVLRQIHDSYHLEYENPATLGLIKELISDTNWKLKKFKEIVSESIRFIESLVWQSIDKDVRTVSQFDILKDIIGCFDIKTILSLNHDLTLDNWLIGNQIEYDDGFHIKDDKQLPEWTGFKRDIDNLKVCKVHGCIDWFEFRITKPTMYDNLVKIPRNYYAERIYELDISFMEPKSGKPALLIGTFNKMLGYLGGIHEILFEELKDIIENTETLIVSGYGFGDKGINTKLTNWLFTPNAHKMLIIHPDRESLVQNSRGAFKNNVMTNDTQHPKVEFIQKKFEEVSIEEITKHGA